MVKRFVYWLWPPDPAPHDWTPWMLSDAKRQGIFGGDYPVQRRFCNRCGLTQEGSLSISEDLACNVE